MHHSECSAGNSLPCMRTRALIDEMADRDCQVREGVAGTFSPEDLDARRESCTSHSAASKRSNVFVCLAGLRQRKCSSACVFASQVCIVPVQRFLNKDLSVRTMCPWAQEYETRRLSATSARLRSIPDWQSATRAWYHDHHFCVLWVAGRPTNASQSILNTI